VARRCWRSRWAVTYLVPQTLLFVPMADLIGRLKAGQHAQRGDADLSDAARALQRLAPDGLLQDGCEELEEQALIDGASRWRAMRA